MLANGTLLGMKKPGTAEFVDIPDLKTVPDMNNEKEKVENTRLSAANKQYEYGVGDYGLSLIHISRMKRIRIMRISEWISQYLEEDMNFFT